ncbi:MAG: threonine synthase, partial [Clostridiales bacterium]|nr:threonine synthase [Clostridiales bacterium]
MKYISTRGGAGYKAASGAILKGIASDGGLYVPEAMPKLEMPLKNLIDLSYQGLAYEILKIFLTDFDGGVLKNCVEKAYGSNFDTDLIAPLVKNGAGYFLELFHGRTLAFKDMALSILPYLMAAAAKENNLGKKIVILTATSGDTGKAALEGFKDVEGTSIIVFYPKGGVSEIQKKQMLTTGGSNTFVFGVTGNFDDTQTYVKQIFTDLPLAKKLDSNGYVFSSANSINIGRLLPQIAYYFYAYAQMVKNNYIAFGEGLNFTVPTGNFGNILAGYYAKGLGLPIHK